MKWKLTILIIGLFLESLSTQLFAQPDTSNNLVGRHWPLVKDAHLKFLKATIHFCSLDLIKSKDFKTTKQLTDKANEFVIFLNSIIIVDSSTAAKVDSLNLSFLKSLVAFFDTLQKDKSFFNQPGIRQEGKKVEYELENIGRQIHDFNYWIYEKNGIKIKFKDINL